MASTKWQAPLFLLILIQHASYFDSTSNHNSAGDVRAGMQVASYFDSTSNHNYVLDKKDVE